VEQLKRENEGIMTELVKMMQFTTAFPDLV